MVNPSKLFKLCVTRITPDVSQVRRDDIRANLPVCLQPGGHHQFKFILYVPWLNPQYLQAAVYFFVEIYDGQVLAEEKVYARKILASVKPNHFRL